MSEFEWTVPEATATIAPSVSEVNQGGIGIFGDFRTTDAEVGELITTMLRFDEQGASPARDSCRGLDDTYAPAGCTLPDKEIGPVGLAAIFDPAVPNAYEAKDLISGGTLHTREVTVKTILRWDIAAQNSYGSNGTIIARGRGGSATEYMPYAIELVVVDIATREAQVRFLWHNLSGVLKTQTGATFIAPASGYFMITCTRRWVSPTEVVLRYYVNDKRAAEVTSVDGEIGGGVDGHTTIGSRYTGGAYARFFAGAIDEIAICNYEMTLEEIESTWLRITVHQPDGYRQVRDLMPPGIPISDDPSSRAQSDLRTLGVALGFSQARVENMRSNLMPDRAYGRALKAWEQITEQPPGAGDSVDRRRRRVVGHLSQRAGVSPPGVRTSLEELLDCNGDDLQVLAFDNTIRDTFATLADERWRADPVAAWTVAASKLRGQAAAGDFVWPPNYGAKSCLLGFENPRGNINDATTFNGCRFLAAVQPTTLPAGSEAGLALWDWPSETWLLFGRRNTGGVFTVGYEVWKNRAQVTAWTVLTTAGIATTKYWLRIQPSVDQSGAATGDQKYDLSRSSVGSAEADLITTVGITGPRRFGWVGFYVRSHATTAGATDVSFNELALRNSLGTRPFYFYVYRDPGLGGSPDMAGANRVLQRMAHAFTHAAVIESLSLLTDDEGSPLDSGPMGAL